MSMDHQLSAQVMGNSQFSTPRSNKSLELY